jgi:hypothetical protein
LRPVFDDLAHGPDSGPKARETRAKDKNPHAHPSVMRRASKKSKALLQRKAPASAEL